MKSMLRSALILFVIGTLVSAQQAFSAGIVDCGDRELALESITGVAADFAVPAGIMSVGPAADTLETFDVEVQEKSKGNIYKEIAVFAIVAAMVGYMVAQLISPGEEEKKPESGGKDFPGLFARVSIPITP